MVSISEQLEFESLELLLDSLMPMFIHLHHLVGIYFPRPLFSYLCNGNDLNVVNMSPYGNTPSNV